MKNLYLIGGGGHCHSCIDVIELNGEYTIKGIFDRAENLSRKILGYEVIDTDSNLEKYISADSYFLITIGQIKTADPRVLIFNKLVAANANMATIVSPRAYVSKHAVVGKGTIVMHDCLINANAYVGDNCIINTKSLIEHDVKISNHCHISTAAIVNGDCVVDEMSFVGSNSVLKEGFRVPVKSIIPAGAFYRGK